MEGNLGKLIKFLVARDQMSKDKLIFNLLRTNMITHYAD